MYFFDSHENLVFLIDAVAAFAQTMLLNRPFHKEVILFVKSELFYTDLCLVLFQPD
jgi:hypothetical protein